MKEQKRNPAAENSRLLQNISIASVGVAVLLASVKFVVWLMTGSLSILASLVDSLLDGVSSFLNLMAIRYSLRSADEDHRFGHGKVEYLAGLAQALFISCSAVFIALQALERISSPAPLQNTGPGMVIMLFAILVTGCLVYYQMRVVRKTGCMAVKADSIHYATDLLTNLGTVAALGLAGMGWSGVDPYIALVIAVVVFYNAWQVGFESAQMLMDRELPPETQTEIADIADRHQSVLGVHDIRTRRSGQVKIIQFHLEFNADLPLAEAHRITKEVELEIEAAIPGADVTIHQDPVAKS